jgi:hypothetical protein
MPYVVMFNCAHPELIDEYLKFIQGVKVFPGCWVARYGGTASGFAAALMPFMNDADGLFVTVADSASWHSHTPDIAIRSVLDGSI